jgi:hypothetical protein
LALLPGAVTPSLQAHAAHLGAWLPFGRAAAMLTSFTQVALSESTVQRLTETTGMAALAVAEAEVAQIQETWPAVPVGPDTAVVSVDGAMVPLVGGDWAEVKTLAVGVVEPADTEQAVVITDLSYASRLLDAQQFQIATLGELYHRGIERADQVVAVNDGATWIQGWVAFHCPTAVRILDFAHATQRLAILGQSEGPTATDATRTWFATMQHRLKHEGMAAILAEVMTVAGGHPDPLAANDHLAYLMKRVDQMAYPTFRAAGWPIGSGIVESANKLVVEARLKGAGMHWARASVNPMLVLRNAVCNDRWREVWAASTAYIRHYGRTSRPTTPRTLPPPPVLVPEPPAPIVPPAPEPQHPWRRYGQKLTYPAKS